MNLEKFRPGQLKAFQTILQRITNGERYTSCVLPMRYGKSDLIRTAAIQAKAENLISGTIVFSPSDPLVEQMVDHENLDEMRKRYSLDPSLVLERIGSDDVWRFRQMRTAFPYRPFDEGEILLSATIQLATRHPDAMVELAKYMLHTTGKPLLGIIDEAHETSDEQARGEFVRKTAPYLYWLLLTATAIRTDGQIIPGFDYEYKDNVDAVRFTWRPLNDVSHISIKNFGTEAYIRLIPNCETTFKEAWNEDPSPLTTLTRNDIDVEVGWLEKGEQGLLRDLPIYKARQLIKKAIQDPRTIKAGVELLIEKLAARKAEYPDIQAIVFSCNDEWGRESNHHAKAIRDEIQRQSSYKTKIITMKSEEDEEATTALKQFATGNDDIVIVKQMGGVGWDNDRLKVQFDLSPTRTIPSLVQRWARPATPRGIITTADVITIADPLNIAIWDEYITANGGETMIPKVFEVDTTEETIKPNEPKPDEETPVILGAAATGATDHRGSAIDAQRHKEVLRVCQVEPRLSNYFSTIEIDNLIEGIKTPEAADPFQSAKYDATRKLEELGSEINDLCKKLANKELKLLGKSYGTDKELWVRSRKRWMNQAKQYAGVPLSFELEQITSIRSLTMMRDYLESQLRQS
jgi:superfamily II DNA or RNA helicase